MLVIADTSALIALAACDTLSLLDDLFEDVRVPPTVFRECTVPGKPMRDRLEAYLADKVTEVDLHELVIAMAGLGLVAEIRLLVIAMQAAGLRYSEGLVSEVLRLAHEG